MSIFVDTSALLAVLDVKEQNHLAAKTAWVDSQSHAASVSVLLTASRRQLSLVDCASFDAMRRLGLATAFTFDSHFAEQGFRVTP